MEVAIRLVEGDAPPDPVHLETPAAPWRPREAILADVAAASGAHLLVLRGHRPAACPWLAEIVARARQRGAAVALEGRASGFDGAVLRRLGVEILVVPLHGGPEVHDALVGPGEHAATRALLGRAERPRVRVRVALRRGADAARAVADAGGAESVTLTGDVPDPLGGSALAATLDACWRAAAASGVALRLDHAHVPPDLDAGPVRGWDANLEALRLDGGWLPGLSAGVRGAPAEHVARLYALGVPCVDAPVPDAAPRLVGDRVAVLVPHVGDALLAVSTLPALAAALRARGVDVALHSAWERPWNLRAPPRSGASPDVGLDDLFAGDEAARREGARRLGPDLLARTDLSGVTDVVVPGFAAAAAVRRNPTWPPGARLHAVDLHLLAGVEEIASWDDVMVTSCFPAFLAGYLRHGVPGGRLRWRPYPVARRHLPPARGDGPVLVAGNQRRDHALLAHALADAGLRSDVVVLSRDPLDVPGVVHRGHVPLPALAAAVAAARFIVLPVAPSRDDAAGITLAALALALGRPVVGTTAWGLVDHVRSGEAGLLVPPEADALAGALAALDRDDALRARLAEGARRAGEALDVETWADALVGRAVPVWPARGPAPLPCPPAPGYGRARRGDP